MIEVLSNGKRIHGWNSLTLNRSIKSLCASFSIGLIKPIQESNKLPIFPHDEISIKRNGETLLEGYCDSLNAAIGGNNQSIQITGRDKSLDLVDCSHEGPSFSFKAGTPIVGIIRELVKPYGLGLIDGNGFNKKIKNSFNVEQGETIFNSISRLSDLYGFIVNSDFKSSIVLSSIGVNINNSFIDENINCSSVSYSFNGVDRFSIYTVKGQAQGSDFFNGKDAAHPFGVARDSLVTRYRPKTIISNDQVNSSSAKDRAEWELKNRASKSASISVSIPSWTDPSGKLWDINQLIRFKSKYLNLDYQALITDVSLSIDGGSMTSNLKLSNSDSFTSSPRSTSSEKKDFWSVSK